MFQKTTLFFVLGLIVIVIGIPIGLYTFTINGGGALAGVMILGFVLIVAIITIIDRIVVRWVSPSQLSVMEAILLMIGIALYLFNGRQINIDLRNYNTDYFVLVGNNGTLKNTELSYSFPFDKRMAHPNSIAVIDSAEAKFLRIRLKSPDRWHDVRFQQWKYANLDILFYSNGDLDLTGTEIDSLVAEEISTLKTP